MPTARHRHATDLTDRRRGMRAQAIALCGALLALTACSDAGVSPLAPDAATTPVSADASQGNDLARVAGSLLGAPHSWPIVNRVSIRGLNATLDGAGEPDGTFELEMELDFGDGPFLQETTEEVVCLEIEERADGTTDIWMSHAGLGWVTVPPGVIHYSILHIRDAPGGDLLTARTIQDGTIGENEGEPSEFCETRPDLSATDPTGLGSLKLMAAEAGNVVSRDPR